MHLICKIRPNNLVRGDFMVRLSDRNASIALDQMKTEIANELDAQLIRAEKSDGIMTRDLVTRAEEQLENKNISNPS